MVPIEVNHGQVAHWEKGWEKFKRPDFVIRDISSFIEREGNYTSFLNECIQKALNGIMKLETIQIESRKKPKFLYRLFISGEFVMSIEIFTDSKDKTKMIASQLALSKLFPAVNKVVHSYFENRPKDDRVIELKA